MDEEDSEIHLHKAVESNDVQAIKDLLKLPTLQIDWTSDSKSGDGRTALYKACQHGYVAAAAALLTGKAQLDASTKQGTNPVWIAAANGRTGVLRLFANAGVDPADSSFRHRLDGRSPICAAAQIGQDEALEVLLRTASFSGAHVPDSSGWSPINYVCQRGHLTSLKVLLKAGADPNQTSRLTNIVDCRRLGRPSPRRNLDGESADTDGISWPPLYVAAYYGETAAVQLLLTAGADLFSTENSAATILKAAALTGRSGTVRLLLSHIAEYVAHDELHQILAPSVLSSGCLGHFEVFAICLATCRDLRLIIQTLPSLEQFTGRIEKIIELYQDLKQTRQNLTNATQSTSPQSTVQLSLSLHAALLRAGFDEHRASVQSGLAGLLELILRQRHSVSGWQPRIHVVGSFSESWGSSFTSLDGNVDTDSDIDVTTLHPTKIFHLRGVCICSEEDRQHGYFVHYENGHVTCSGFAGNPSLPYGGSRLRPALDQVAAYECCAYPQLRIFHSEHKSQLSSRVVQALAEIKQTFPCHLVPTTLLESQKQADFQGSHLRLSTTFFERCIIQNLTTVQGQVYVTLKYLIKRFLSTKVNGLKSYHAKTIMFYMLDEVPMQKWQPHALVELVQQGLERLHDCLTKTSENECMMHFFLPGTVVYLKRNYSDRHLIMQAVKSLLQFQNLFPVLREFMKRLRSCDEVMRFHPFVLHPILGSKDLRGLPPTVLDQYSVYDAVMVVIRLLTCEKTNQTDLMSWITCLPDCARTTRHCLKVLGYLKFGMREAAKAAVLESVSWTVSKGVSCPDLSSEISASSLQRHLNGTNWMYKFGFRLDSRPTLSFLPDPINKWFPCGIRFNMHQYYVNFQALLKCLTLHLLEGDMDNDLATKWFLEVVDSPESDVQELLMVLNFCKDKKLLIRLIHEHSDITDQYETLSAAVDLLANSAELQRLSIFQTIETACARAKDSCN